MSFFQALLSQPAPGGDTSPDGKQAFWVIGDSIAKGTNSGSTGPGPLPTALTAWYYCRSEAIKIQQIGANDLILADVANRPSDGSPWPQFAIQYNTYTGNKAVIIPTGVGGTNFGLQAAGGSDCWDPAETGNLYNVGKADVTDALSELGLTELKGIIINLGVNDARYTNGMSSGDRDTHLALVDAAIDRFFTQIQSDFPNIPILICQVGRDETANGTSSIALGHVRKKLKSIVENNTNCHILGTPLAMHAAGLIGTDAIHPTQPGNNTFGINIARWFDNYIDDPSTNKWARSIIATHFDDLSANRKTLITDVVTADIQDYLDHENLINLKTTTKNNCFVDWAFLCVPVDGGFTFTANDSIASGGNNSTIFRWAYIQDHHDYRSATDDVFIAVKIKANGSSVGAGGTAIGASNATTTAQNISQPTSGGLTYRINDFTTTTYATDTRYQADTEYLAGRSGGNKYLYKNGSQVNTAAVAATAIGAHQQFLGAINSNGTTQGAIICSYEWVRAGKFSTVDQSAFYTEMEYLIDHWND